MKYSNARLRAVIENWPSGSKRVKACFLIERDAKRGERGVRVTDGAPKKLTYAKMARIVDGDDGRTYIAELTVYGHISIMRGDMKIQHESIFERDPGYADALELFAASTPSLNQSVSVGDKFYSPASTNVWEVLSIKGDFAEVIRCQFYSKGKVVFPTGETPYSFHLECLAAMERYQDEA